MDVGSSSIGDDEAHAFLTRMRSQKEALKEEQKRLQARVAELEQQLVAARTHLPSCRCRCPGCRLDSSDAMHTDDSAAGNHAAAPASASASVSIPGVSQPVMDILFGSSQPEKAKDKPRRFQRQAAQARAEEEAEAEAEKPAPEDTVAPMPPRVVKSPPRSPILSSSASSPAHHLSPPKARAHRTSAPSSPSAGASPAASVSEADRMLAMLDGDELNTSPGKKAPRKRKSGTAQLDAEESEGAANDAAAATRAQTSKFIRVTSPEHIGQGEEPAPAPAPAAAADVLSEQVAKSQDAFDQEIFEQPAAAAEEGDARGEDHTPSPSAQFDYGADAAPRASDAEMRRARWMARVAPLNNATLDRASRECNVHKVAGNESYTAGGSRVAQALVSYTHAIRALEAGLSACGHAGEAELKPWIELESSEMTLGADAVAEEVALIRELTTELHPESAQADFYAQMKILLRQLASVYANRATCYAKKKPAELLKAISDVNYVLQLQPKWFKGYGIKASILVQQKCFSEALLLFEQALTTPSISSEETKKISDRMVPVRRAQAKQVAAQAHKYLAVANGGGGAGAGGGSERMSDSDMGSSQSCGSLTSTHMGISSAAGAGAPYRRSPARSHSAAAGSSSSTAALSSHAVGAAVGSVAQPIAVHSSGSGPLSLSHSNPAQPGTPLSELAPVHPPSLHTPVTPPLVRQQSEEMQAATAAAANERAAATKAAAEKEKEAQAKEKAREEKAREEHKKKSSSPVKKEQLGSSIALPIPLSDVSNRMSPVPMRSRLAAPGSPVRPGSGSRMHRSSVHDLTESPKKPARPATMLAPHSGASAASMAASASARMRASASPSRSPATSPVKGRRPPSSPQQHVLNEDWFVFPLITIEGVRDLVGDETFAESNAMLHDRYVEKVKVEHPSGRESGADRDNSKCPRLLGRVFRSQAHIPSSRRSVPPSATMDGSKENNVYAVSLRFDAEQRCTTYSCECRTEREAREDERDRAAAAAHAFSPPPPHPRPKVQPACKHVGAVLLVLRRKQEESEKLAPLDWSAAERARRSMYVTPSRRKNNLEQMKEAAMRAELESLTNAQLQDKLHRNHQSKSGTKEVLIARILENATLGNLPRCNKCSKGSLYYAAGGYWCHGSFDPVTKRVLLCDFHADRVERSKWQA